MKKFSMKDIKEFFPSNKNFIRGEEYITWDYRGISNRFIVVCDDIDQTLIVAANANKNEIHLISGDIVTGLYFTIQPLDTEGNYKTYNISSRPKHD